MGTPNYNSGWIALSTASPAGMPNSSSEIQRTHNVSSPTDANFLSFLEYADSTTASSQRVPCNQPSFHSTACTYQLGLVQVTSSTAYIKGGTTGYTAYIDRLGTGRANAYGTGVYRYRTWGITADYSSGLIYRGILSAPTYHHHNLKTDRVYVQPVICSASSLTGGNALVGAHCEDAQALHICALTENTIYFFAPTRWSCWRNRSNTITSDNGARYVGFSCWK
jgi:hypothetical protein